MKWRGKEKVSVKVEKGDLKERKGKGARGGKERRVVECFGRVLKYCLLCQIFQNKPVYCMNCIQYIETYPTLPILLLKHHLHPRRTDIHTFILRHTQTHTPTDIYVQCAKYACVFRLYFACLFGCLFVCIQ